MTPEAQHEHHPVTDAVDKYLAHHHYSLDATKEVNAVMDYWRSMVELATDRALDKLYVPENVILFPERPSVPPPPDTPA